MCTKNQPTYLINEHPIDGTFLRMISINLQNFGAEICRCKSGPVDVRCLPEASPAVGVREGRVSAYCVRAGLLADALEGRRAGV